MSSYTRYLEITQFDQSAAPLRPVADYFDYGLIAVLAMAQRLHIELLPITWQATLGTLGEGGQAGIKQALVDIKTSFAFKRFHAPLNRGQDETSFQAVVSEIVALSHPIIREHPHIVRLEGLCWDIPDDNHVWPVLMFEKTEFGSLHQFASSGIGESLHVSQMLSLCFDIGLAIRDMHRNGGCCPAESALITQG
jgi:hypothetical protein